MIITTGIATPIAILACVERVGGGEGGDGVRFVDGWDAPSIVVEVEVDAEVRGEDVDIDVDVSVDGGSWFIGSVVVSIGERRLDVEIEICVFGTYTITVVVIVPAKSVLAITESVVDVPGLDVYSDNGKSVTVIVSTVVIVVKEGLMM